MARHLPRTELILRENGLWAILERTGSKVNVVETGHVDQALAAPDLESWRTSGRLSSTSQAWIKAAGHLRDNVATGKHKHGGARTTRADILILLRDQGYRCAVSGHLLDPVFDGPWQPSVDRIDSSRGYEPGNIRVVTYIVNIAMNTWGEGPLRELAERMVHGETPGKRPDAPGNPVVAGNRLRLTSCEQKSSNVGTS